MVLLGYRIDKIIFDYYKIKKQAVGESFELPPLVFLLTEKLIIIAELNYRNYVDLIRKN